MKRVQYLQLYLQNYLATYLCQLRTFSHFLSYQKPPQCPVIQYFWDGSVYPCCSVQINYIRYRHNFPDVTAGKDTKTRSASSNKGNNSTINIFLHNNKHTSIISLLLHSANPPNYTHFVLHTSATNSLCRKFTNESEWEYRILLRAQTTHQCVGASSSVLIDRLWCPDLDQELVSFVFYEWKSISNDQIKYI